MILTGREKQNAKDSKIEGQYFDILCLEIDEISKCEYQF